MKGIKVIDVGSNPEETQFGTCELYGTQVMVVNYQMTTTGKRLTRSSKGPNWRIKWHIQ